MYAFEDDRGALNILREHCRGCVDQLCGWLENVVL